jgi:Uma2 family endonuclease
MAQNQIMTTATPPATLVSESEYLRSDYQPDRELLDGQLMERHLGDQDHSDFQTELPIYLSGLRDRYGFRINVEHRIKVGPARYRVPDIHIVLRGQPKEAVLTHAPFIIVEIVSPDDTLDAMQERVDDYVGMGVPNVWIVNPRSRRAWVANRDGFAEMHSGILQSDQPPIRIVLSEVFAAIDRQY